MPSGATANARTAPVWPVRVWRACPVCGSQIRTVPSSPAEASQEPSGATANAATAPVWPVRVWRACPVCGSQIRTVSSSPAEASQEPSGATANARTAPVWPVRVWRACPVCGSQIRTVVVVAGGGQPGAVRGDRQRRHPAGVAGQDAQQRVVRQVGQRAHAAQMGAGDGGEDLLAQLVEAGVVGQPGGERRRQRPGRVERAEQVGVLPHHHRQRPRTSAARTAAGPTPARPGRPAPACATSHRGSASTASSSSRRPAPHRWVANHDHRYACSAGRSAHPPPAGSRSRWASTTAASHSARCSRLVSRR